MSLQQVTCVPLTVILLLVYTHCIVSCAGSSAFNNQLSLHFVDVLHCTDLTDVACPISHNAYFEIQHTHLPTPCVPYIAQGWQHQPVSWLSVGNAHRISQRQTLVSDIHDLSSGSVELSVA